MKTMRPPNSVGAIAGHWVFYLGCVYAVVTVLGLLSLKTKDDPIGDPYFSLMEFLTLLIAPAMMMSMATVHHQSSAENKLYSLLALGFMVIMTTITSAVHAVVLLLSHSLDALSRASLSWLISFRWPSVVYALDILAWDWFFAFAMFFAASAMPERRVKFLLWSAGLLSLIGLLGVPLQNMQIRNIGILGYAVLAPIAFLLMGRDRSSIKTGRVKTTTSID